MELNQFIVKEIEIHNLIALLQEMDTVKFCSTLEMMKQ